MRHGDKGMSALSGENQLFGIDFHDNYSKRTEYKYRLNSHQNLV